MVEPCLTLYGLVPQLSFEGVFMASCILHIYTNTHIIYLFIYF